MTRDEWQMQMLILTHEETNAEHYNAALHTLEAWDVAQRMTIERQAQEIARLREALQLLYDVQNGCPLPKYQADWDRAMSLTQQALKETSK